MSDEGSGWGEPMRYSLSELEAFDAMRVFLEAYWRRGGAASDDIAVLLGNINRDDWADRGPLDPAQWSDWLNAVAIVAEARAK